MKNPFTNTSSNLSNIFHNNIHRKKGESLKVRSTKKFFPGSAAGAAALKFGFLNRRLPTSGLPYERPRATRALWWGAPQTADPPTPGPEKHQKSFRRVGESFLAGIRVAHQRLLEQKAPPPVLRVPKIGKKRRFDTFFGRFFAFRKSQNAVNYSIFVF